MYPVINNRQKSFSWLQAIRRCGQISYALITIFALFNNGLIAVLCLMGLALLGGAFYCGWLCPVGTAQEWIGYAGRKILRIKQFRFPVKVERWLMLSRYLFFAAGLLAWIGFTALTFIGQPYQTFMSILTGQITYITGIALAYLVFFLVVSLLIDRPFCRYFCTQGALFGALSMGRLFSIRRNSDTCINCQLCDKACPTQVIVSRKNHVRHPQCINCMECISACPVKGTLKYEWVLSPGGTNDGHL